VDQRLQDLQHEVRRLASIIRAPDEKLPTYVSSRDMGHPHVEIEGSSYVYVVRERDTELDRRHTGSRDELLYWMFEAITFSLASDWELLNRVPGEDSRRGLFAKQIELLDRVDPVWASRYRHAHSKRLTEVGLA
jgi:hypothetical protein